MSSEKANIQIEVNEKPQKTLIHEDPEIYTMDKFLTKEECQHFIDISKDKFKRSVVSDDKGGKGKISDGRTSDNTWIKHNHDSITFTIANKITNMLVKLRSNEPDKIKTVQNLVEEYVDVDGICERL